MKLKLLQGGRDGQPGDIIEVSPERAAFLLSIEAAEPVKDAGEQADKPEPKKKTTKKK